MYNKKNWIKNQQCRQLQCIYTYIQIINCKKMDNQPNNQFLYKSSRSTNRHIKKLSYFHKSNTDADQDEHQDQNQYNNKYIRIRESYKSVNYQDILNGGKSKRLAYSPYQISIDRDKSLNKATKRQKNNKYKNLMNRDQQKSTPRLHIYNQTEVDSQKQTIKLSNDRLSRYQAIVSLTQQQNQNLKQQNRYLVQKLRKMHERQEKIKHLYNKAKSYKSKFIQVQTQIQIMRQQRQIYKLLLQDFKEITIHDIPQLKQKVIETQVVVQQQHNQQGITYQKKNKQTWQNKHMENMNTMSKNKKQRVYYINQSNQKNKANIKQLVKYQAIQQLNQQMQQKTLGDQSARLKINQQIFDNCNQNQNETET